MEPIDGVKNSVVLFPLFKRAKLVRSEESAFKRDWYIIQILPTTNDCPAEERC